MPTEREFREWQRKQKKSPRFRRRRNRNNFPFMLSLALIILSAWISWKDYQSKGYSSVSLQPVLIHTHKQRQYNHVIAGSSQTVNALNYDTIDQSAFSISYDGSSVSELAAILSQYATTQAEKARIIYAWITHNIAYDVSAYFSGDYGDVSAQGVLKNRRGVCSGYANLYQALAKAMGLETVVIEGYAKGLNYIVGESSQINHAWNAVKIDKAWYLVDSTWGAGTVNGTQFLPQFTPHYFATSPAEFIYDHLPAESVWQLLSSPYTKEQFDSLPQVSPEFFKDGLKLVNQTNNTILAQGNTEVILQAPNSTRVIARLSSEGRILKDTYTRVQRQDEYIRVTAKLPYPGTYQLEIFASSDPNTQTYPHAITYQVIAK
ncbi:transglutaminase domain-containing protein [Gloeothece verrucosa]|uniref:Transglutaminase domain protein n=1 Tax=Gloeothece verrucosa (strain PCC 7822) TaxID=497965 RepID=E0U7S8_GLOV7|nr:transglutaminase domain-containing protein [Gloeothece verrucosa]ADN14890.1 transglutaminase domain protein [Gloeothece verrucosa PCC 7822]